MKLANRENKGFLDKFLRLCKSFHVLRVTLSDLIHFCVSYHALNSELAHFQ